MKILLFTHDETFLMYQLQDIDFSKERDTHQLQFNGKT